MRFLLHAAKKSKASAARSSVKKTTARASCLHPENSNNSENVSSSRQWGQQCSPNCGCVVRFESIVDENSTITSASYHAKQLLISHDENGHMQPHFTTNHAKPLLTECKCQTLHSLSQKVVSHIQGSRLDQIKNSFIGGASPAVVHASLKAQKLPTSHAHCFSLMQQAVVAMTCGYLPKTPVDKQQTYQQYLYERYSPHVYETEEGYGVDENSGISVGASAVDIFDMHVEEEEEQEQEEEEKRNKMKTAKLTWETYVDELYAHHYGNDENDGVQWSA